MLNKKLVHFNTYSAFEENKSNLYDWTIVFIGETKQIYTHGNFYDCDIEDINELNDKIDEILSELGIETYEDGVYAVTADGQLIDYTTADNSCIAVALVAGEHKFMIEKNGESNTTSIKAAYAADGASDTGYTYFYWGMYRSDVENEYGITEITQVGGGSTSSSGYLPKADGTYSSTPNLSSDYTTWTSGALSDFNGKANTKAIQTTDDTDSNTTYANMGTYCTKFNETATENQGFSDWYIPACGQLALMYLNMTAINEAFTAIGGTKIASPNYWSSSEYSSDDGWRVNFYSGYVNNYSKDDVLQVRFIRDISTKSLKDKIEQLESSIPTKVSQLENDKNYIENGDGYNSGVYIALQSGKLINPDDYDSSVDTAIGVAVIDPKANFIIGLNHTTSIPWGTSSQGLYGVDVSGLTNYTSSTTAATDLDGVANTDVITAIYSGTDCAAGLARSQTITYGDSTLTGYLGSAGEWWIALNNHEALKSAMAIAGGTTFQTASNLYYWASTEYSSSLAWFAYWYEGGSYWCLDYYTKSLSYSYYCVVPFYKIDNEITTLSKINIITTPAGSSTAPIYIDSNGNIASTAYGGGTKVTLNGTAKGGSAASFYAPTSYGTSGYMLKANGSGSAPTWVAKTKTFTSVSASSWVDDTTYEEYPYSCTLSCSGVTSSYYAEVIFDVPEAVSGNYAPVCSTGSSTVTIYSKVNDTITIPTIFATLS